MARTKKPKVVIKREKTSLGLAYRTYIGGAYMGTGLKVVFDRITVLKLPAIYQWPEMAEEGGLAAYGPRVVQLYRQLARQVVKALNGTHPGNIPVEQPTNFELVINLRTAKTVGLEIPLALTLRADKLIE